jgi:hypothetical protein
LVSFENKYKMSSTLLTCIDTKESSVDLPAS